MIHNRNMFHDEYTLHYPQDQGGDINHKPLHLRGCKSRQTIQQMFVEEKLDQIRPADSFQGFPAVSRHTLLQVDLK